MHIVKLSDTRSLELRGWVSYSTGNSVILVTHVHTALVLQSGVIRLTSGNGVIWVISSDIGYYTLRVIDIGPRKGTSPRVCVSVI